MMDVLIVAAKWFGFVVAFVQCAQALRWADKGVADHSDIVRVLVALVVVLALRGG